MPKKKKVTPPSRRATAVPTVSDDPAQLLTVPEAARLLRVRPSWIYAAAKAGGFPAIKVGRYLRVPREELQRWVREQQRSGRAT